MALLDSITSREDELKRLKHLLANQEDRIEACRNDYRLFSLLYFSKYHQYKMPEFHKEFYDDLKYDRTNNHTGNLWVAFRESAKTSITKIGLIHDICYHTFDFGLWVSYDEKKAASNLYDVALELQTNEKLIEDFGQLFYEPELDKRDEDAQRKKFSKKKSIKEFITTTKIKLKAYSTGMSIRGEVYQQFRPQKLILDDIETMKTIVSEARTQQVVNFLDEMLTGASPDAKYLILGNRISNTGSIQYLQDKIANEKSWQVRDVPLYNQYGVIAWPDKYVMTDKEADEINEYNRKNFPTLAKKVSIETKRRIFGLTVFNREMLNEPLTEDEREIKLDWLQKQFNDEEIKNKTRNRYIAIDVADSKARSKTDPDFTATAVVDVDAEDNWYTILNKQSRLNAPELIDWIFYLWEMYKPIKIGIEKKSFEDQILPYIRAKSDQLKIYPVVVELKHGGTRKEDRIRGSLQGRLQHGKIHFKQNATDNTDDMKKQLYDFPKSKHDDLIDALAYIAQLAFRPFNNAVTNQMSSLYKEFFENKAANKRVAASATSTIRKL